MATLTAANREWASRKDDERFTSLTDLDNHMSNIRTRSMQVTNTLKALKATPIENSDGSTGLVMMGNKGNPATMTNYSFGQMADILSSSMGSFPKGFVQSLPAPIAADVINHGISTLTDDDAIRQFLLTGGDDEINIRSINGENYGRIYNSQITNALVNRFGDGVSGDWKVPGEFGKAVKVDKANTTIFGSDRDMFVFLCDEEHRVTVKDRRNGEDGSLARGFFVWNSEVGAATLGVATFLFDYVCSNRLVWGATEYREIKMRHSLKAPERFLDEVSPMLSIMANEKASITEAIVTAAQNAKVDDMPALMGKLSFNPKTAKLIGEAHETEEGRPMETLWDVSTGITAFAKSIPYQSERVAVERKAGLVIDMVAA